MNDSVFTDTLVKKAFLDGYSYAYSELLLWMQSDPTRLPIVEEIIGHVSTRTKWMHQTCENIFQENRILLQGVKEHEDMIHQRNKLQDELQELKSKRKLT